jgi:glycosyltransferase involved in cell wall biosynthesis
MEEFYSAFAVKLIRMPYDAGVCASRNCLVSSVKEPYILLCDDDFVLTEMTDLSGALTVLQENVDIGIVGGRLFDYFDGYGESVRNWELFLHLDRANRVLTGVPITNYAPRIRTAKRYTAYLCDAVLNFAIMRRSIFENPCIRWDERFKSNGEHEDFYLNLKSNSTVKVAYLPTMIAGHHHPEEFANYRSRLRDRTVGWTAFFDKWGIDQYLEVGNGVRTRTKIGEVYDSDAVRERFYLNADLSLERSRSDPVIIVRKDNRLEAVAEVNGEGEHRLGQARQVSLTIRCLPSQTLENRLENGHDERADEALVSHRMLVRYGLIPPDGIEELEITSASALFKYNPFGRPDTDFTVWYRLCDDPDPSIARRGDDRFIAIVVRWYSSDGTCLTWGDSEAHLYGETGRCWKPLMVHVPLHPSNSRYLRFEIVARQNTANKVLGVGFYCKAQQTTENHVSFCSLDGHQDVLAVKAYLPRLSNLGVGRLIGGERPGRCQPQTPKQINGALAIHSIRNVSALKSQVVFIPLSESETSVAILQEVIPSESDRNIPVVVALPVAQYETSKDSVNTQL